MFTSCDDTYLVNWLTVVGSVCEQSAFTTVMLHVFCAGLVSTAGHSLKLRAGHDVGANAGTFPEVSNMLRFSLECFCFRLQ